MKNNFIENICGPQPENFIKVSPTNSNYIFQNDPNFNALNLYDFFGRSATVNSYTECFYYVELGFEPVKTTIFDIGLIFLQVVIAGYAIFKFLRSKFLKNISINIKLLVNEKKYINFLKNSKTINSFFTLFFAVQSYFLFDFVRTKSVRIPRFIDEYITLTSSVNFFTKLNFDAGEFIGGNYSVSLTSGPISALGSSVAWILTDKLTIARISNFFWICILQLLFSYLLFRVYKLDFKFLFLINFLFVTLIPYWQGPLYSLGEVPSAIIFVNALFLFPKFRNFSLILFSLCIFYGKLLNLVPFAGFYASIMLYEKKIKYVIKDSLIFSIPLFIWLLLVNSRYPEGNAVKYLSDQYNFILNHQSSGVKTNNGGFFSNFIETIQSSEFTNWTDLEKFKLVVVPLLFILLITRNKKNIDNFFGRVTVPIITSFSFVYLWFWFLNTTKWIRHTQHYIVLLIIATIYFINFNILKNKFDLIFAISIIAIFIQNNRFMPLILVFVCIYLVFKSNETSRLNYIKFSIVVIILLDITIPYFEKDTFGNLHNIIEPCNVELKSPECLGVYLNQ